MTRAVPVRALDLARRAGPHPATIGDVGPWGQGAAWALGAAAFVFAVVALVRSPPRRLPEPWALAVLAGAGLVVLTLRLTAAVLEGERTEAWGTAALLVAAVVLVLLVRRGHRRAVVGG